jgi:hypothetical protein
MLIETLAFYEMMANVPQTFENPKPHMWTLRFKHHKTTIFLFVDQQQPFSSIRADLLSTLKKRGVAELDGQDLPEDPEDLILGVPLNKNNPRKGWIALHIPATTARDGKGEAVSTGGKKSVLNETPLGAGLKDGAMLAFKIRKNGPQADDGSDLDDNEWDVLTPSYDDEEAAQPEED